MLFNSYAFIFIYLPIVLVGYFFGYDEVIFTVYGGWLLLPWVFMHIGVIYTPFYYWRQYFLTL